MEITYYGHSCFGVELAGKHLLFDPFITPNGLASGINAETVPADFILVSHAHEDHIADLVPIAKRTNAWVICSYEIYLWLQKQGVKNVRPMGVGGKWIAPFGKVKCVVAVHSSSLPDGSYGGQAMGFVVESAEGNFYFAGDTALTLDMKLIGEYRKLDFAFLPIGDNFTMGVDNAIMACNFIQCENVVGMHYDTFDIIKIDQEAAKKSFARSGKQLTLMNIGETITKP